MEDTTTRKSAFHFIRDQPSKFEFAAKFDSDSRVELE